MQFTINVTDVRNAHAIGSAPPLSDYLGALFVKLEIRVTDRSNPAGKAGTVQDVTLPVNPPSNIPATCAATADPTVGSTCAAVVSLNSRIPGAIVPDRRSSWRIRSLALQSFQGGTNTFIDFAVPGVFVP